METGLWFPFSFLILEQGHAWLLRLGFWALEKIPQDKKVYFGPRWQSFPSIFVFPFLHILGFLAWTSWNPPQRDWCLELPWYTERIKFPSGAGLSGYHSHKWWWPSAFLVTTTETWGPFLQIITSVCSGFNASTNFEQANGTWASWLLCERRWLCSNSLGACHSGKNTGCGVRSPILIPAIFTYYLCDWSPDTFKLFPRQTSKEATLCPRGLFREIIICSFPCGFLALYLIYGKECLQEHLFH